MTTEKAATRRSERLVARIAPEDKALLERAAAIEGASVANFVVSRVREAAAQVVRDHETIRLNEEESRCLVEALLAPTAAPTKAFLGSLKLYRETVVSDVNPHGPAIRTKQQSPKTSSRR